MEVNTVPDTPPTRDNPSPNQDPQPSGRARFAKRRQLMQLHQQTTPRKHKTYQWDMLCDLSPIIPNLCAPRSPDVCRPCAPCSPDVCRPGAPCSPDACRPAAPHRPDACRPGAPRRPDVCRPSAPHSPDVCRPGAPRRPDVCRPDALRILNVKSRASHSAIRVNAMPNERSLNATRDKSLRLNATPNTSLNINEKPNTSGGSNARPNATPQLKVTSRSPHNQSTRRDGGRRSSTNPGSVRRPKNNVYEFPSSPHKSLLSRSSLASRKMAEARKQVLKTIRKMKEEMRRLKQHGSVEVTQVQQYEDGRLDGLVVTVSSATHDLPVKNQFVVYQTGSVQLERVGFAEQFIPGARQGRLNAAEDTSMV